MLKYLLVFLLGLFICQNALAQKRDTLTFYMRNDKLVSIRDSADRYRMVISPDSSTDANLYTVKDFYLNGKIKLVATAKKINSSLVTEGRS